MGEEQDTVEMFEQISQEQETIKWGLNSIRKNEYRDYIGKKVGSLSDLLWEFVNVFSQIEKLRGGKMVDATEIRNAVNNYKAMKYCYNGNTFGWDNRINKNLDYCSYDISVRV